MKIPYFVDFFLVEIYVSDMGECSTLSFFLYLAILNDATMK